MNLKRLITGHDHTTRAGAFLRGVVEFRQCLTWADSNRASPADYTSLDAAYDRGRELAHRVTFRRFEE